MAGKAENREWSENVSLLCKTVLEIPPSCLEFVPSPKSSGISSHMTTFYHEYFVVGTYNLETEKNTETEESTISKPQSKTGSLLLFRYCDETLNLIQTLPYPSAVFDLHFIPGTQIFAIVSSTGTLAVFQLTEKGSTKIPNIETIATHEVFKDDVAPTFFTWAPGSEHLMAIATSDGGIYFARLSPDYQHFEILNNAKPITRHSEYAWCCTFAPDSRYIYSGGDDSKLRIERVGISLAELEPEQELEQSGLWSKGIPGHDAGVTFILPLPIERIDGEPELLLTGSYDDHIRIISIPEYPARPKVLSNLYLGGGVWRLKIMDSSPTSPSFKTDEVIRFTVLASCMHVGCRILSICGSKVNVEGTREWKWEITVLADMKLHKSMNYASDVQLLDIGERERAEKRKRICVSSSFYDRLLCVWSWDPEK